MPNDPSLASARKVPAVSRTRTRACVAPGGVTIQVQVVPGMFRAIVCHVAPSFRETCTSTATTPAPFDHTIDCVLVSEGGAGRASGAGSGGAARPTPSDADGTSSVPHAAASTSPRDTRTVGHTSPPFGATRSRFVASSGNDPCGITLSVPQYGEVYARSAEPFPTKSPTASPQASSLARTMPGGDEKLPSPEPGYST